MYIDIDKQNSYNKDVCTASCCAENACSLCDNF